MDLILSTIAVIIFFVLFPGLVFIGSFGLFAEWFDRRIYARAQNRVGPRLAQPFYDFIKLMAKEELVPEKADKWMFNYLPVFMFAAVLTAYFMLPFGFFFYPIFGETIDFLSFEGDLVVFLYLMTIPTIGLFLIGWTSSSLYAVYGSTRTMSQLIAYEVPLLLAGLGPAVLAGTWRMAGIVQFFNENPAFLFVNVLGFLVALVALQAKLERIPFDIPEAETELAAGSLVEYSGRRYAMTRLVVDLEMVTGAAFISAIFLGGYDGTLYSIQIPAVAQFVIGALLFFLKTILVVFILSIIKATFARVRIDQMVAFSWKWLAPLAVVNLLISVFVKVVPGVL